MKNYKFRVSVFKNKTLFHLQICCNLL